MLKVDLRVDKKGLDNLKGSEIGAVITGNLSKRMVEIAKENSRVDTGDMQKGWNRSKIGTGRNGGWRIYNTVPYTVHHEFGTVKMSAQPMLGPAMDEVSQMIPEEARRVIEIACISGIKDNGGGE